MTANDSNHDPLSKRLFDVGASLAGLVLLSPVLLILAVLIRWKLGSPVLFRQTRPGKSGKPFTIYKFRTMLDAVDQDGKPLPDAERLTSFGSFLRRSSLDELPELWNVIVGDMSLVGPRPLIMEYLERYSPRQDKRNLMRPGITGLAQISGRNAIPWEERFDLDVFYVENWSFMWDLKIILRTVKKVLFRDGITAEGHASMTEFLGSETSHSDSAHNTEQ